MGFFSKLFSGKHRGEPLAPTPKQPRVTTSDDEPYLHAAPLDSLRRRLLWMDPPTLGLLTNSHTVVHEGNQLVEVRFTVQDIEWARRVNEYAVKAEQAGQADQHQRAIDLYKNALRVAPGCDLYLMSIGCCYANIGDLRKA